MQRGGKQRAHYQKNDFSDVQIYQQIRDEIRQIRESSHMTEVDKLQRIDKLYRERKQAKRRRKLVQKDTERKLYSYDNKKKQMQSQSDEPGEINEQAPRKRQKQSTNEQQLTTKQLGELIKQVTLTRKKLIDFLDNRKFEDLVKGCFVRYKSDSSGKEDSYIIAQIIGIKQGVKEYSLSTNQKTKLLLVLQQSNIKVVQLPIVMVSNQSISGSIQITKWIQENKDRIPKERQIKEKLEQHSRLLTEQLSSQEIDKNIENRAVSMAKGTQQVKSLEDLQNLIDFIVEKIDNYDVLEEEEIAKRKQDKLQLIQIKRKKHEFQQVRKALQEKKRQFLQARNQQSASKNQSQGDDINKDSFNKQKSISQKLANLGFKIEQKRQDAIKQKWRHRQMLLCTAQGYQKMKLTLLQNHTKYDVQLDV